MKPEGVSQAAWDAADLVYEIESYGDGGVEYGQAQILVARAIAAAVAAEREACAQVADTHLVPSKRIAAAIRMRSEARP